MKVTMQPNPPTVFKSLADIKPKSDDATPGFVVRVDQILDDKPSPTRYMVVRPEQVPALFDAETLKQLRKLTGLLTKENPTLHLLDGVVWLGIGISNLISEWPTPDKEKGAILFEALGEALELATRIGAVETRLKMPDYAASGFQLIVKGGKSYYAAKTPPLVEIMPGVSLQHVPQQLHRFASAAFDPKFRDLQAVPFRAT